MIEPRSAVTVEVLVYEMFDVELVSPPRQPQCASEEAMRVIASWIARRSTLS